jgi:copper chaperone
MPAATTAGSSSLGCEMEIAPDHVSRRSGGPEENTSMCNTTASYTVVGMTCNSCVNKVTNAVTDVEGVLDVDVDIADGTLQVSGHIDDSAIRDAVAQAGYRLAN